MTDRRTFATTIAVITWIGLALQVITAVQRAQREGSSALVLLWQLSGYFTILTNTLVAVIFTALARAEASAPAPWTSRPGVLSALTVHILFVGIAYSVLLRNTWHPQGLDFVADEIVHDVVPLLVLVFWVRHVPKGTLRFGQLPTWIAYPTAYLVYALGRGAIEGWYPYYFIDVGTLGYATTFKVAAMIMGAMIAMCAMLIAADRRLGRARA